jgi:ferredoxin
MNSEKVIADYDLCEANAVCAGLAPHVFRVDEEDNLHILQEDGPWESRDRVELAVQRCPKNALKLVESDG